MKRRKRTRKNPSVGELFDRGESAISTAERSVSRVKNASGAAKSLTGTDLLKYGIGLAAIVAVGGAAWYWSQPSSGGVLRT